MVRFKLNQIRTIFTSKYWLIVSVCGAFFSFFALDRGGVVVFIDTSVVLLALNVLFGDYRLRKISTVHWVTLAVCFYFIGLSYLFYPRITNEKLVAFMVRMLCVVFAIHCLSLKKIDHWTKRLFFVVLSTAVCWQAAIYYIYNKPYGTFSNMHYLASFTVITLPPVVYALFATKGWSRYLFVPVILLDIDLILKIGSRPAILGLTTGTLFVAVFLIKGYWRWIGLLLILAILSGLYLSGYAGLDSRFEEILVNLTREERVYLWKASWEMLKDNTLITWILGSGIGAVHSVYPQYTPVDLQMFFFPHLHVVEVLYDSGIVGAILFLAGLLSLLALSVKFLKNTANKNSRILMRCLLVSYIAWLIHSGLTFPFYSKYAQYSLAYILGPMLVLISGNADKSKRESLPSKPSPAN